MCILAHKVTILVSHNFLMNHCKKFLSFSEAKTKILYTIFPETVFYETKLLFNGWVDDKTIEMFELFCEICSTLVT